MRRAKTVYLEAREQELSSDDDAREYLLRAMEEDHFILFEQKIESISSEGTEAQFREILLRLQEEEKNMLPPGGFFEVAEHYDLMPAIDRWVIRKLLKACAAMKREDQAWRMPLYCLNLSSATLRDRTFPNHVRAQLQHWEIAGNRLCLEINHEDLADRESDISVLMEELSRSAVVSQSIASGATRYLLRHSGICASTSSRSTAASSAESSTTSRSSPKPRLSCWHARRSGSEPLRSSSSRKRRARS